MREVGAAPSSAARASPRSFGRILAEVFIVAIASVIEQPPWKRSGGVLFFALASIVAIMVGGPAHAEPPTSVVDSNAPDTQGIDLPGAIELALRNSPELKAAQSDVGVAAAQRDRAAAGRWPTIKAQGGLIAYRRDQRLYPAASPGDPAVISHHVLGGDLLLSVPLYAGGRISGAVNAAELAEEAARGTSQWTKAELLFRVTAAYYSILAQRRLISALVSSETAMLQHIDRLAALVEERKAAPLDRQRVEVRLAALRQMRIQEETALRVQTLTLLSLIGISGGESSTRVVGELVSPTVQRLALSESLLHDALSRRADYRARLASVRSQERRIGVARAGHYPQLLVQGSYGLRWGLWPSEQPGGSSAIADVGLVGLFLDVPIFEGGRVKAEVREEQARLTSMRERLRQMELRIRLEVEAALLDVQAALERVALSEATVGQAVEAFRVEAEKQAGGMSTISDVLSAQSDLIDAEASRARALADANIAAAALRRAMGEDS